MIDREEIVIRPAAEGDGLAAIKLLKKLGLNLPDGDRDILAYWERLWRGNPYYKMFNEEIQYGWVMEHEGRIVGFFGSIPRIYYYNSKPMHVSIASQWGVEKEYRAFTSLLSDQYFEHNICDLKIVSTAIKPTGRIFDKYGGHKIPNEELDKVYMIPISLFKLMAIKYKSPLIKSTLHLFNKIIPWKIQYSLLKRNEKITQIQIAQAPDELDAFFKRYHATLSGLVAARTTEIIKWLGAGSSDRPGKACFVYREGDLISGFASIARENIAEDPNIRRYKITDLIAESAGIKTALLKELIRYAHRQNADILEIHHPGMISKDEIPLSIVMERKHAHFPLYYQTADKQLENKLQERSNWHISPFDGDTSL